MLHLRYDFLWKDDMKGNFEEFMESEPHTTRLQSEVQRMCDIQKAVTDIPMVSSMYIKVVLLTFHPHSYNAEMRTKRVKVSI